MKKIFSFALAALLCTAAATVGVSAHKDFASWGDVPRTSEKIVLDGKLDEIYSQGLVVDIDIADGNHATGKAYMLWADDGLYCAIEVNDPEICALDLSKNAWELDGVEITYDWKNDGSTRHKWMIHYDGTVVKAGDATEEAIEVKATKTDSSYIIESKAALPDGVTAGSGIGINLLLDDMSGGNSTRTIVRSKQSGGASENEVAKFDYVTLSADKVSLKKEEAPTQAAQTADVSTVAALLTAVSGAALMLKKRK